MINMHIWGLVWYQFETLTWLCPNVSKTGLCVHRKNNVHSEEKSYKNDSRYMIASLICWQIFRVSNYWQINKIKVHSDSRLNSWPCQHIFVICWVLQGFAKESSVCAQKIMIPYNAENSCNTFAPILLPRPSEKKYCIIKICYYFNYFKNMRAGTTWQINK